MHNNTATLKRSLSLQLITFYGLGNILGAGIYVLVGKVAGYAGLLAPLSFLIASLVAALTAFSYAELSSRYPVSAGVAIYLQRGFNISTLSLIVGLVMILTGVVSAATITRGFVGYAQVLIHLPDELIMILLVSLLGSIAAWGIVESVRTAVFFTLLEVIGLILIIVVASPGILEVSNRIPEFQTLDSSFTIQGIFIGAVLAFYAFIGFEDMVTVAEEVKQPVRNMPRAIIFALSIATLLYFLIAFLCIITVSPVELAQSNAPLALVYERATGSKPVLISIIGIFAVVNGALIQIIMASRLFYGLSREGWLPKIIGKVNPITKTPINATIIVSATIIIMALWLPIETLAKATSFLLFILFTLVNMALWRIKNREDRHPENIIKLPVWVPITGAISSFSFVVFQIIIEFS